MSMKRLHGKLKTLCGKSTLTSFRLVALQGRNFLGGGVEGDRKFALVMINHFGLQFCLLSMCRVVWCFIQVCFHSSYEGVTSLKGVFCNTPYFFLPIFKFF